MSKSLIADRIARDIGIDIPEDLNENQIIDMIAFRVEKMLKADPDLMMSYLYRLDVEEVKINAALENNPFPVHLTFAQLIWERQKQRIETKKNYKQDPIEGWEF